MAAKQLAYGVDARDKILDGVTLLSKAVKATLGPRGRNVVLGKKWGSPTVTKDGVTVAKEIELKDPYENMGAQMVKEVATKTSDIAGDGTTTATLLGRVDLPRRAQERDRRSQSNGHQAGHRPRRAGRCW